MIVICVMRAVAYMKRELVYSTWSFGYCPHHTVSCRLLVGGEDDVENILDLDLSLEPDDETSVLKAVVPPGSYVTVAPERFDGVFVGCTSR